MTDHSQTSSAIRFRAVAVAVIGGLLICALTPYANILKKTTPLGGGHFPLAPFFILFWMTLLVALANRFFKRPIMTGQEMTVSWMGMTLVSGIAYTGLARTFFFNLTAPFHFATPGNGWKASLQPLLPSGWYPQDTDAIKQLYDGVEKGREMGWMELFGHIPWHAWIGPLFNWAVFILLCYAVMICLVNLISRQWIGNENMNFPLLRVPLMMQEAVDDRDLFGFLTNRFLLAGLSIPVFIHLQNGLSYYYPQFPQLPTLILAGPYFPKFGLFSGFHKLKIYIYPAFIGFAFLTSRQISFSFWVFFLLGGLMVGLLSLLGYNIPAAALGTVFGPTLSRPEEMQMIGAYGVFFLFILWLARFHIADIVRESFGKKRPVGYGAADIEWFPLPVAFWGGIAAFILLVAWCGYSGMPLVMSTLFLSAGFMVMVVAVRIICQGGLPYFTLTAAPLDGITAIFGAPAFSGMAVLGAAVMQKILFVDLRESVMPSLLHAGRVTQGIKKRRWIALFIFLMLAAGVAVSFIAMLTAAHKYGMRDLGMEWAVQSTTAVYENVHRIIVSPQETSRWVVAFMVAGAGIMTALAVCYHRFYWWPLHPIGYLTAYSSAMRILWFSFFIGWACNSLCIRYGGVALFRKMRFFFVGLIIGDFLMAGIWAVVGIFSDTAYLVLPD